VRPDDLGPELRWRILGDNAHPFGQITHGHLKAEERYSATVCLS
jgi:hypothetical protein